MEEATRENNTLVAGKKKDSLERIMNKYGIERAEETGINRKHMSIDQYKADAEQIANEGSLCSEGNKNSCIAK